MDRQLVLRISLLECRSEAFVEVGLKALDGTYDGNVWERSIGGLTRDPSVLVSTDGCIGISSGTSSAAPFWEQSWVSQYILYMPIAQTQRMNIYHPSKIQARS